MDRIKEKVYRKRKLCKTFTPRRPQILQKMLAVGVSFSLLLAGVPLGGQSAHVAAAGELTKTVTALTPSDLDTTGNDKTKWKQNGDVYETQNQGSNSTACTMEVPVEVTAGYAELEFEWKVSSEADWDFLWFELKDAGTGDVLQSNQKSGADSAFDKVWLKLDKGTYTLTFTYQGDSSGSSGKDTGYVTNLNLVTYSGVSAISKTMFAEPTDLIDPDNFSLATADYSKVGKISFGTRPGEVKYYKEDSYTEHSVDAGPITWLVAGSEKFTPEGGEETGGLVLYSKEPLVSANVAVYEYDEDSDSYPPPPGGADSRFQPSYFTDQSDGTSWVGSAAEKASFTADWGSYTAGQEPDHVLANHWGASNLRKVLQQIYADDTAPYKGFFNATEKGLMSESTIKTYDMQDAEFDEDDIYVSGAKEYITKDVLYAPRYDATLADDWEDDDTLTVGAADSLKIDKSYWGGIHWLRSPYPGDSGNALVALPGIFVGLDVVFIADPSISAAFRLNLSSVLFTSAASAASSAEGGKFSKISANTPMTLRVHKYLPEFTGTATLSEDKKSITVNNAAEGDVLMVQSVTDDGQNWSYSKKMNSTGSATVGASEVVTACNSAITDFALSDFSKCNIWLERTTGEEGCTVTYASTPIVAGATESTSHAGCTITSELEKPATCTDPGHEAHYKCSVCGQLFSDAAGEIPIEEPTEIPAKGHSITAVSQLDATCTEPGHEAHYKCSVCGQLFSDEDGNSQITEPEEIPAHGLTHVEEKAATCAEAGHKEYWQCKDTTCNKLFSDKAGTKPIDAPTQVAALGHKWDDGVVATQPTTSAPGVKTYKCSVCGHTRTETIPKLDWGSPMTRADGKTQYVVDDPSSPDHGKTSIEIKEDNLSQGDILWLLEESDGTSAWYGVDLSSGAFDLNKGLRFYVQWLSPKDADYNTYYSQLDDAQKARVEGDNGWIFLIGVEDPAGNKVQPSKPVSVYVQIGDDWDVDDLNAYYIAAGGDETVPVDYLMLDYPGGTDTFGRMTLSHFSPYIIFDELTDAEKAARNVTTGDLATQLLVSGLAIVLVSSLGVMLKLITSKKKFED